MGIFKDRNGKTVKDGDTVLIETTYSGHYGQGQRCVVRWDASRGQYNYTYRAGSHSGETNFDGVADFIKVTSSDPA